MKNPIPGISILVITALLSSASCKKEEACTTEFRTISVSITNFDGSAASFDNIYLVRTEGNDTLEVTNPDGSTYNLVDDNTALSGEESFTLEGYQGSTFVLSENYVFKDDGCHVVKVSGKGKIVLD